MKKIFLFLYFLSLVLYGNRLQSEEIQIRLNVDWAIFQYDQKQHLVEIYYDFLQNKIKYISENDKFIGLTLGQLKVYKDDTLIDQHVWKNQKVIHDSSRINDLNLIIDRLHFIFDPGDYKFRLIITDINNPSNVDSLQWDISLIEPNIKKTFLSDIQLASSITQNPEAAGSPFYKNTLLVVPNPSLIFSSDNPALFFYVELYNLTPDAAPEGYLLSYYITNTQDNLLEDSISKTVHKNKAVHPSVEFGMLNVGRLNAGAYKLHIDISDMNNKILASSDKKFFVYQEGQVFAKATRADSLIQYETNIFNDMDSSQVQDEFESANYLMDKELKSIWNNLDNIEGKRQFLFQFWRMQDPDLTTEVNEFRQEYQKRIEYANAHFRAFMRDGWHSDRGRVYVLYGQPSDIERHPNEPNVYPHEIWRYDQLQGGVIFVFGDLEGHRDYRLIHSDLIGEIQNYNYMDALSTGGF